MSEHTDGPWQDGPGTFTRGVTPYWEYKCGCKAAAPGMDRCPTHALAPEMVEMLRDWPVNMPAAEWNAWHARRRALLARLDGAA